MSETPNPTSPAGPVKPRRQSSKARVRQLYAQGDYALLHELPMEDYRLWLLQKADGYSLLLMRHRTMLNAVIGALDPSGDYPNEVDLLTLWDDLRLFREEMAALTFDIQNSSRFLAELEDVKRDELKKELKLPMN